MTDELTLRQRRVLEYLRDHVASQGRPPTMREASARFGWSSNGAIRCHLVALERKGLIQWNRRDARGIRVIGDSAGKRIARLPIVGAVPAGLPAEAIPESDESLAIDESMFPAPHELFVLRVYGDSMVGAGIMDRDRLIVRRAIEAHNGQIVVANIDGETTVKRYLIRRRHPVLHPENPVKNYLDIIPKPGQEWRVEGIAVGTFRVF